MPQEIINVEQLQQRQTDSMLLIDVREQNEYEAYHVPGAELFALSEFDPQQTMAALGENSAQQPVYVLCQVGGRAMQACLLLEQAGFANTVLVDGGTQAWANAGYELAAGSSN